MNPSQNSWILGTWKERNEAFVFYPGAFAIEYAIEVQARYQPEIIFEDAIRDFRNRLPMEPRYRLVTLCDDLGIPLPKRYNRVELGNWIVDYLLGTIYCYSPSQKGSTNGSTESR